MLTHPTKKLAAQQYGPFTITKVISPVVYQIDILPQWRQKCLHDVFHAQLLTPYRETEEHGANFEEPPPNVIEGEEEYEVEEVLASRRARQGKKLQYLLKWQGYSHAHDSWEPHDQVNTPELIS